MDLNKEVLIKKLKQYYIKTDIFSLIYELPKQELNDKPEYFKFKNITYDSLDINKYANSLVISNNFILSKTKTVVTIFKLVKNEKIVNYGFVYGNIINNKVHNNSIVLSLSIMAK